MDKDAIINGLQDIVEYQRAWIHRGHHTGYTRSQAIRHVENELKKLAEIGLVIPDRGHGFVPDYTARNS